MGDDKTKINRHEKYEAEGVFKKMDYKRINHSIDEKGRVYREYEYFIDSDKKYIKAIIFFKSVNAEFKKVYDALRIIESKYKDKIEIKIKLQKIKEEDLYVSFYNQKIYEKCYRLDTYINIVEDILKKGVNKNGNNAN